MRESNITITYIKVRLVVFRFAAFPYPSSPCPAISSVDIMENIKIMATRVNAKPMSIPLPKCAFTMLYIDPD
jgi:hypothetical protein